MREDNHLSESYWPADTTEPLLEVTLGDVLRNSAAEIPDAIALVDGVADPAQRRRWTYAELLALVEKTARALAARFSPGERVAIISPNSAEWVVLQLGLNMAGLVLVPINPAYRTVELEVILASADAVGVFYVPRFRDNPVEQSLREIKERSRTLRELCSLSDFERFVGDAPTITLPKLDPRALLQIQFTSGTAGVPKGACLHHQGTLNAARFVALRARFPDRGVWLNAMPMFHVGGSVVCLMGALAQRGTFVIAPGFDPALVLQLMESERANITLIVPTMILAILDHEDFPRRDLSSMVTVLTGAAMVSAALVERAKSTFHCDLVILFGQTEVNGVVSQTTPGDRVEDQSDTVGRPLPQAEVRISDESGRVVPIGEPGEICVRGYQTMHGYCGVHGADALDPDGWLHTGDIGTMDSRGYLRISTRIKDMIIRGGMNIYPREIEDVLGTHEQVADVSVVGVPDERWGEVIGAVIRAVDPANPPHPDVLHAYVRERISAHKAPVHWYFVTSYPLTPSGKIQKFVLRERIAAGTIVATAWSRSDP